MRAAIVAPAPSPCISTPHCTGPPGSVRPLAPVRIELGGLVKATRDRASTRLCFGILGPLAGIRSGVAPPGVVVANHSVPRLYEAGRPAV